MAPAFRLCVAALAVALLSGVLPAKAVARNKHKAEAVVAPLAAEGPPACMAERNRPAGFFTLNGGAVQGGVMSGIAPRCAADVKLGDLEIPVDGNGRFLIGFDRDADGPIVLRATLNNGQVVERALNVLPGDWRIEHVNVSKTAGVPSDAFLQRRLPELDQIKAARAVHAQSGGWLQQFIWPVTGRISGRFGAQRIYRGEPGSYHGGVDVAARAGTPFVAPADGVVVLAAQTPFTLEGYLLIVDHGMGLNSAFLHCSSLAVKVGDVVRQGQMLGTVGATGRASGPHMHWGMMWNGARLDPQLLVGEMG